MRLVLNALGVLSVIGAVLWGLGAMTTAWSDAGHYILRSDPTGSRVAMQSTAAIACAVSAPIWFSIARIIGLLEAIAGQSSRRGNSVLD